MLKSYPKNRYKEMLETLRKPEYSGLPVAIAGGAALGEKLSFF